MKKVEKEKPTPKKESYKLKVELEFISDVLGSQPKNQSVVDTYIKTRAKGKETKDEFASPLDSDQISEKESKAWTGFQEEKGKCYIMDYAVKGFLKHSGNIQKEAVNIKALRSKIDDLVFVTPRKIFFDQPKTKEPFQRPLRAMTMQGPRVSLVKSDVIKEGAKITFEINVPVPCEITKDVMIQILEYGQFMGIGQFRNGGFGQFKYKILK